MATRTQTIVRRDINRLNDLIQRYAESELALAAIQPRITETTDRVNAAWQAYQAAAITGDREREERDSNIEKLNEWIQKWRPVLLMLVPGAGENIRVIPPGGGTHDDIINVADDMIKLISENPAAEAFRELAMTSLGNILDDSKTDLAESITAWNNERATQTVYSDAIDDANTELVLGLRIIRTAFGATSPEYKRFIARDTDNETDEAADETTSEFTDELPGEDDDATDTPAETTEEMTEEMTV